MPFSIRPFHRFRVLCSMILVSMAAISLVSCFYRSLDVTVNAVSNSAPPQPPMFIVISPDSLSFERHILHISALIEAEMSKRGYQKATSLETANIGVLYKYSINPIGSVSSVPDSAVGGHATSLPFWLYSPYPQYFHIFQITVIDLQKSKTPETIEILWQGELHSARTTSGMSDMAQYFIEALFDNYGTTVSNRRYSKRIP